MRYDDLSHSGSQSTPAAHDDYDVLPAGSRGPATGNAITGAGTVSGSAGADTAGAGNAHIVGLSGSSSSSQTAHGGQFEAAGRYGDLKINANGDYVYHRHAGSPDGVEDVFTYTLADKAGATDLAKLVIRIEGDDKQVKVQPNAQRVVAGSEVITLPEGVELSDIHVVGRDLVVTLPDGSQMVIVDGAVFVPQLALGGVEIPATNLAALLIDSEPRPAAGGPPPSSGGNFAVPVSPLDPGVPLGDLLPPTALDYTPPEFKETYIPQNPPVIIPDTFPTVLIQTPNNPAGVQNATAGVAEAGLPSRGNEPAGTAEAADGNSTDNDVNSENTTGTIVFTAPDGLQSVSLVIGGVTTQITGALQVISTTYGTLTITSYNPASGTIGYSYILADNTSGDSTSENIGVVVRDTDGDTATASLVITIADDAPIPVADTDSIAAGSLLAATGNVITDAEGDGGKDNVGADNALVSGVAAGNTNANLDSAGTVGAVIVGTYGQLTLQANGNYSYVRNAGSPGGVTDTFTYTVKDGDGDLAHTTLTISIGDAGVTTNIPAAGGATTTVYEAALAARGSEPQGTSEALLPGANDDTREAVSGTIGFTAADGLGSISLGGTLINLAGGYPQTVNSTATGTLVVTGVTYNAVTGVGSIAYTYTLLDNTLVDPSSVSFALVVTDSDPAPGADSSSGNLVITIIDDAPIVAADTDSIASGVFTAATGNVITGVDVGGGDANATDGSKDNVGADNALVSGVAAGNTNANLDSAGTVGAVIVGTYGQLTLQANGNYSYVRNAGSPGGVTDTFTYTVKDGDGDLAHTTLTISIGDAGVTTNIPAAGGATTTVYEAALAARGSEPQGTSEALLPGANDDTREAVSGTIGFTAADGLGSISLGGTLINLAGGYPQTVNSTATGTLVVTGVTYNAVTGVGSIAYTYTLLDNTLVDPSSVSFALVVTDSDPAPGADSSSGNLVITIIDDAPIVAADTDSIASGVFTAATGNVITGVDVGGGDANATDGSKDNVGADNALVSGVAAGNTNANLDSAGTVGAVIVGTYGQLTLQANGNYSYVRNAGSPGGVTDTFTYTVKDGDGDLAHTTLTISIGDAGVTTNIPAAGGATTTVYEAALAARGSEPQGTSEALLPGANDDTREAVSGTIGFTAADGLGSISLGGTLINLAGGYPQTVNSTATGTLVVTGVTYNAVTGVGSIAYTYTLLDNTLVDPSSVSFALVVTDSDPAPGADSSSGNLVITIIDDAPIVAADTDSIASGVFTAATGNVITGVDVGGGDANATDGSKDNVGADNALVSGVAAGNTNANLDSAGTVGAVIVGTYGQLTLQANGNYSYVRNAGSPGGVTDTFTYTVKDGDGDLAHTTLTISIGDAGVTTNIPAAGGATTTVYEAALAARGSEPQGTSEALLPGANDDTREAVSGTIGFTAADGLGSISLGGTLINLAGGYPQTVNSTATGTLVVTGVTYNAVTGVGSIAYTYTLLDNTLVDPSSVSFALVVTDSDPAPGADSSSGNLVITIIDDAPIVAADTDSIASGVFTAATGNVITGVDVGGGDANATDGSKDNVGADNALVSGVAAGNTNANLDSAGTVGAVIVGTYGQLTLQANGNYSYVRNAGSPGGVTDTFTYTVKDGDGDLAHTTLTISIGDAGVTTNIPAAGGATTTVYEAALAARGSEPQGTSEALLPGANDDTREAVSGTIGFTAADGLGSISLGGTLINLAGGYPQTVNSTATGTLVVTGVTYNAVTGVGSIAYTYTLLDNTLVDPSSVSFALVVTDSDPAPGADSSSGNLVITIIDDAPIVAADTDSIASGVFTAATGNVITGVDVGGGDANATDGSKDNVGADNALVSGVAAGNTNANLDSAGTVGAVIVGTYGQLTLQANGNYSYVRNAGSPGGVTDTFTYTVKDGDGDLAHTTLTISIGDAGVTTNIPAAGGATTTVYEAALAARGSEPQGTSEALLPGANDDTREAVSGTIGFTAADGLGSISLGGTLINLAGGYPQTVNSTATGTLVVTGVTYNAVTGVGSIAYTYTLLDNTLVDPSSVSFALVVTDSDPAPGADSSSGNLVITIIDDAPIVAADTDSIASGVFTAATGNVITGVDVGGGDANATDGSKDNVGADNALVSGVAAGNTNANLDSAGTVGAVIVGTYGQLTLQANGNYSYVRNAGSPGGVTDTFTYTVKDGDGDLAHTTLTISIGDAGVTTNIPAAGGATTTVYEAALAARGSEPQGTSEALLPGANDDTREAVSGTIGFTAADGLGSISLGGTLINLAGGYPQTVNSTATGTLVVTGVTYNAVTGVGSIAYTYTLLDNTLVDPSSVSFALVVTDSDPAPGADSSSGNLVITIIDDAPIVAADTDSIASGVFTAATGNVITGVDVGGGDANATDGSKDNVGADNALVSGVAAGNTNANLDSAGTVGAVIVGTYGQLTLQANGNYSYVRNAGSPGGVTDTFTYTVKDGDGDLAHTTLTISIGDAGVTTNIPAAGGATTTVYEAALAARGSEPQGTSEALLPGANDDTREAVSGTIGFTAADGLGSISLGGTLINLAGGYPQTVNSTATGTLVVTGVTYNAVTGVGSIAYTYTLLDNTLVDPSSVSFALVVTDSDPAPGADSSSGNLVITIIDDAPIVAADTDSIASGVFTAATGNVITGVDVGGGDANATDGSKDNVGADNALVSGVAAGNTNANLDSAGTVGAVIVGTYGQLTLQANGNYSYVRNAGSPGGVTDTFTYTVKDGDGDLAHTTLTISIDDARPVAGTASATVDDEGLAGGITGLVANGDINANAGDLDLASEAVFKGVLGGTAGDGASTFLFQASLGGTTQVMGQETVTYTVSPDGLLLTAKITSSIDASRINTNLFTVQIDNAATGAYTLTLLDNVLHASGSLENDVDITIAYQMKDIDNDLSAAAGVLSIKFDDDMPVNFSPVDLSDRTNATATLQDNALVNDGNALVTRLINDADNNGVGENFMGADGFGSLTFTGGVNGAQLMSDGGVLLKSGGSPIFVFGWGTGVLTATTDATNTSAAAVVFTATLNANGGYGSASTYTLDFNHTVDDGSGFIFSSFATAPAGQNVWIGLDSDGNGINVDNNNSNDILITGTAGGSVNTSSSDIGSNNQWIDGGEGIRLDFVTDVRYGAGDEKTALGYTFDGHYVVTDASFQVKQGGPASVRIQAVLDSDSGTITTLSGGNVQIDLSSIVVTNLGVTVPASGYTVYDMGDGSVIITGLDPNDKVSFDTNGLSFNAVVLTSAADVLNPFTPSTTDTFGGGHFALGAFGFNTATSGNPIDLTFNVTATDADGDTSTGTIDITLVPVPLPPVIIDANHDGQVNFLGIDAGVLYDVNGDGHLDHTAWVAPGDAILFRDADGNGTVSNASEFVFGGAGITDLQALHAMYGDQLDASDADFTQFGLWNDANSNGIVDAGEVSTLAEAGIASISLVSDGQASTAAGGDVSIAGYASFTDSDGNVHEGGVADASFNYTSRHAELEQRIAAAASNSGVLAAAAAAAGLAASQAAHAEQPAPTVGIATDDTRVISEATDLSLLAQPDVSRSLMLNEHQVDLSSPAPTDSHAAPATSTADAPALDNGSHAAADAGAQAPADTDAAPAAPTAMDDVAPMTVVADMPSVTVDQAQHNAVVEHVLLDALQGDGGHMVDALLANIANDNPGLAETLGTVASPDGAAVPGWDMGDAGHMQAAVLMNIAVEAIQLHHDAVQPAMNG